MLDIQAVRRPTVFLLILAFLVSALFVAPPSSVGPNQWSSLNAAVVIKTKKGTNTYDIPGGIRGIDVSKWNGGIDWSQVAKDDVNFAFIRASYGDTADPNFISHARAARSQGIHVGAYHYARFTDKKSMQAEADFFIGQLRQVDLNYPIVLDIELRNAMSKSTRTSLSQEFIARLKNAGYTNVLLYSYSNFLDSYIDTKPFEGNLWVANYLEQPKHNFKVWQFSNTGKVKGISGNVDINIATADLSTGGVRIPKTSTDSAKNFLNQYYDAGIDLSAKLDLEHINSVIARGFQAEVNKQLGGEVAVDGAPGEQEAQLLSGIQFTSETKGRITTLVQCKLMYSGYYLEPVTGRFDSYMIDSIKRYQQAQKLPATGELDLSTWRCLLKT